VEFPDGNTVGAAADHIYISRTAVLVPLVPLLPLLPLLPAKPTTKAVLVLQVTVDVAEVFVSE
jgi:hypothetical protein